MFRSIRFRLAKFLIAVTFVWPFINVNYLFPQSHVEINFLLAFVAIGLAPDLLFKDVLSLFLIVVTVSVTALWGPQDSALRVIIGVVPCVFIVGLHRYFLDRGEQLIPASVAFWALLVFVGFSTLQQINFHLFPIIPEWFTNGLAVIVPRYMDVPYDEFGVRGVQGWASEPSSAAMTCFSFSVVAIQQDWAKRWWVLLLFAVLTTLNKSVYAMLFFIFLAVTCLCGMRKKLYAILAMVPLAVAFSYFVLRSSRIHELSDDLLIFGTSQDTNRELLRLAQIIQPLISFPSIYKPVSLFGLNIEPIGLLPLLVGYGSVVGCLLYCRLALRSVRLAEVESVPLALAAIFTLSFISSPDFIPVIVAVLYALAPRRSPLLASRSMSLVGWMRILVTLLSRAAADAKAISNCEKQPVQI
jgi:hypothetical protein